MTNLTCNEFAGSSNGHHHLHAPGELWWTRVSHCVHVVDDDAMFCDSMSCVLGSYELHASTYPSAERFLTTHKTHHADCLLLDLRMEDMSGIDLLRILHASYIAIPILMVSAYNESREIVTAMQEGASDYLVKPVRADELLTKVTDALFKDWQLRQRTADTNERLYRLTEREREVMTLFLHAKTTMQIARELGISPKTVEKHRINIFGKMNVDSIPALMRLLANLSL